jgi:hypothetical protein
MKTLKVLSVLFAALSLLFMINAFLPAFTGTRLDWIMIAILILFVVMIPSSMAGRIKMEKFPEMLPSLGMIRVNIILNGVLVVASAVCVVVRLVQDMSLWMYLAAVFVFSHNVVNNIIHYRVKKNSGEGQA